MFARTARVFNRVTRTKTGPSKRSFAAKTTFATASRRVGFLLGGLAVGAAAYYSSPSMTAQSAVAPEISPKEFKAFPVAEVLAYNHNTKLYKFRVKSPKDLPVACFVLTKYIDEEGKEIVRPYTPIDHNEDYLTLLVKTYPAGKMSKHLASLKPGDDVEIKGLLPKIQYKPNMKKRIGMFAGGTGITPMLQVIEKIIEDPSDKTVVDLVFNNTSEDDVLLKERLDSIAAKHANIRVHYSVDKPSSNWKGLQGYVNENTVKQFMPAPGPDSMVFVCGPPGYVNLISGPKNKDYTQGEVTGLLGKLGYGSDNVFKF